MSSFPQHHLGMVSQMSKMSKMFKIAFFFAHGHVENVEFVEFPSVFYLFGLVRFRFLEMWDWEIRLIRFTVVNRHSQ